MEQIHILLKRQLKRYFGDQFRIPNEWQRFVAAVDDAYRESDKDREMLERSLELSSQELLQANSELRESEEKFRNIFNASLNAIYTTTFEGEILDVNPAGVSLFGFNSLDEVKKVNIKSLYVDLRDREKFIELARKGPVIDFETRFKKKDGGIVEAIINAYPLLNEKGELARFQGAIIDVTEHKRLDQMKDQFISSVTHELRTPLSSLKVHVDYALAGKMGPLPEKIESSLQIVKRNTDRLVRLTDELLDIRRMESGKFQLNLEPVNFREIVDQTAKEMAASIDMRTQNVRVELPSLYLPVFGDSNRLSQVLVNLLSNASKFTPEHGEITIRIEDQKDRIQIQVSDTGIGIKKEDLPRVFEPFSAIQKSAYIKGTGLGLSITKGIVEAHGGKIWAESAGEGKGATFTFTLPKPKEAS